MCLDAPTAESAAMTNDDLAIIYLDDNDKFVGDEERQMYVSQQEKMIPPVGMRFRRRWMPSDGMTRLRWIRQWKRQSAYSQQLIRL
mgnify:CR=1 FL=1